MTPDVKTSCTSQHKTQFMILWVRPLVRQEGRFKKVYGNTDMEDVEDRHKGGFEP